MAILYDESSRVFRLDTDVSSYAIQIYEHGYLAHLYYGPRVTDTAALARYMCRGWFDSFSPRNPHMDNMEHVQFSLDFTPQEYPCTGSGDSRASALQVRAPEGNVVTDLRYVAHRIFKGKPALSGLPATFAGEGEAESLEIEARDPGTGVKVFLLYTVFAANGAMARSVRVENPGSQPVDLRRVYSLCLDLPTMDYELVHVYGHWNKENTQVRQALRHGTQSICSRRGMTGHNHNPFVALLRQGAGEEQGEAVGVNLVYSGNFSIEVEVDAWGCPRLLAGINPDAFSWRLEPGESFQSPEAVMVFSAQGLGGMSRAFHRLYNSHLIHGQWAKKERPLLINSWEAAYFDFDAQKLVDFAKAAKDLGIEMLVMDDGWFGARSDDHRALGDWQVNEGKLGCSLEELISQVNAQGLKFGIWYEPEMVSPDSDLYRAHPDWAIGVKGREGSLSRHQLVLDMSRKDVRDNIFAQMEAVLGSHNIEYVKWDCNRNITEAASAALPPERQGEFFHRYVLGVYDLMERVTTRFPHILLENCSGGGGRFDAGMLYYSPQIWTSDNTDPIERLTIQFGASLCYPVSSMGAHISANPRAGIATRAAVAMMGTFGYEMDPRELTPEEREAVKAQVAQYHKYYRLIREGDLYRLTDPNQDPWFCDWAFVSPDKREVLFTRVMMRRPGEFFQVKRLVGLDPDMLYTDEESGETASGALLMGAGLDLSIRPWPAPKDGDCVVRHLVAK
ncbi:alpha-galactosidase [Acutalibacter caecimuris]|uniref:alpha-galactosidase n=1 Tax=Acutalibacter caecimuris TaxID=3093657 RepID=UPI002AC8C67E|nr:alpha-galactosidase [Acutalibacter sp. M00118]